MLSFSPPSSPSLNLLLLLLLLPLLFLSHLPPALSCAVRDRERCRRAPFVPGYNLAGEGYDVVKLRRKGAYLIDVRTYMNSRGSCSLRPNPHQGGRLQKLPVAVVDWRAVSRCTVQGARNEYTSISSLLSQYSSQESRDWKVGLNWKKLLGLEVGGTRSNVYSFATKRLREDRYSFSTYTSACTLYRFRLVNRPPLSRQFRSALASLPRTYSTSSKSQYRRLIEIYGTHYIRQVDVGGRYRRITAARTCLSTLNGYTSDKVHKCLSLGVSLGLGIVKTSPQTKSCSKILHNQHASSIYTGSFYKHFTQVIGGRGWVGKFSITRDDSAGYKRWQRTLKDHPDTVQYSLRPMYELVPNRSQRMGLKAATEDYLRAHAVRKQNRKPTCSRRDTNLDSSCCPKAAWRGKLVMIGIRAWRLKGDLWGKTEAYVKVMYGRVRYRSRMIQSNYPSWNTQYSLGKVDTHLSVRIEVWDKDVRYDDRLVSCSRRLKQGINRVRCSARKGNVEVTFRLTCDPHLTGDWCHKYKPSRR